MNPNVNTQDSDDLESLFDSIVAANVIEEQHHSATAGEQGAATDNVLVKLGTMTRTLHNTLRELGLNTEIEKATSFIPDARDRLNYVATLTEQAAEKVLNATEAAKPLVDGIGSQAQKLGAQWQLLSDNKLDVEQFKALAKQTKAYLAVVPEQTRATNEYLMEIVMAQDFQDLTGQVIKKIIELTQNMESQLLELLLESAPPKVKADYNSGLLNGPVINPDGRKDIVANQDQVDDLLESLGF